jgi:uncharacterized protein (TIGR02599 family)
MENSGTGMTQSMNGNSADGFTLVELLTGMAVLSLLLVLLLGVMNQTSSVVRRTSAQVDAFQQARTAFDVMARTLSQATLNTYRDYYNSTGERRTPANAGTFQPAKYDRASDLHFLIQQNGDLGQAVFFAAPMAFSRDSQRAQTEGLLNACGYFVEFGDSAAYQPALYSSDSHFRYRLMQSLQATESFPVFSDTTANWTGPVTAEKWPIAANVIALIVQPRLSSAEDAGGASLSDDYQYDSRTGPVVQRAQLPPVLQVTMVVIDKISADRLENGSTEPSVISGALAGKFTDPLLFETDIKDIEAQLSAARINYQIFTTAIALRESKWSSL